MNVLMISSDPTALRPGSRVEERWGEYASLTDQLTVLVVRRFWWQRAEDRVVSPKLTIRFCGMWRVLLCKTKGDYDVVSAQTPFHDGLFGYLQAIWHRVPLQLQVHTDIGNPAFYAGNFRNKLYLFIARYLLPRASRIRVVSERIKDWLISNFKFQISNSIDILPVFVDTEHFKNAPITVDLHAKYPQFEKIVLMLSRLTKEKNIPLGITAFQELLKTYPKAGLIIVGDGPEREALRRQNAKCKMQNAVVFEPWCADPVSYYKTADCFLNTSNYEGYGMTTVEALAAGCPVVSTDVGIAREAGASVATDARSLAVAMTNVLGAGKKGVLKTAFAPQKAEYLSAYKDALEKAATGRVLTFWSEFGLYVRYVVSGVSGAIVNLGLLFVLTHFFAMWYIAAASTSFIFAFFVSFFLQKYWTFEAGGVAHRQLIIYLAVSLLNLGLNAFLMYVFVEGVFPVLLHGLLSGSLLYVLAAFCSNALICIESFFAYKFLIFPNK